MIAASPVSARGAQHRGPGRFDSNQLVPALALGFVLLLQTWLVFQRSINWDEFNFYRLTYDFVVDGKLEARFQTFHTRLFAWLLAIDATTVSRIVMARVVTFACELVVIGSIVAIAERFTSRTTALLAALAYLSSGFVLQHGFAFRFDPLAASGAMLALAILTRSSLSVLHIAVASTAIALAAMVTVKVVFYAPAFAGVALYRWLATDRETGVLLRLLATGIVALAIFGLLYAYHTAGMSAVPGARTADAANVAARGSSQLAEAGGRLFKLGPQPYWNDIARAAALSIFFTLCLLLFPAALIGSKHSAPEKIVLAGFALPLAVLPFYHNTAPYFYPFILAPVAVAMVVSFDRLRETFNAWLLALGMAVSALAIWAFDGPSRIDSQESLIAGVNEIFETPVGYFDFCFMLPNFQQANGFMTLWGVDKYLESGRNIYSDALANRTVPLLLENDPMFTRLLRSKTNAQQFTAHDAQVLRDTYVHFWSRVWIAGEIARAGAAPEDRLFRVPGPYTVRGSAISVDGTWHQPGDIVMLERGVHRIETGATRDALLLWGERLSIPDREPPERIWTYF